MIKFSFLMFFLLLKTFTYAATTGCTLAQFDSEKLQSAIKKNRRNLGLYGSKDSAGKFKIRDSDLASTKKDICAALFPLDKDCEIQIQADSDSGSAIKNGGLTIIQIIRSNGPIVIAKEAPYFFIDPATGRAMKCPANSKLSYSIWWDTDGNNRILIASGTGSDGQQFVSVVTKDGKLVNMGGLSTRDTYQHFGGDGALMTSTSLAPNELSFNKVKYTRGTNSQIMKNYGFPVTGGLSDSSSAAR